MRQSRIAIGAGGGVTAAIIAFLFLLPVFFPSLEGAKQLRLFAGLPGGFVAGALAWKLADRSPLGIKPGAYASMLGLVLFYAGVAAYIIGRAQVTPGGRTVLASNVATMNFIQVVVLLPGYVAAGIVGGILGTAAARIERQALVGAVRGVLAGETAISRRADDRDPGPRLADTELEALRSAVYHDPDEADFETLLRCLATADRSLRKAAVETIVAAPGEHLDSVGAYLPEVLARIEDSPPDVRRDATRALARIASKRPDVVAPLADDIAPLLTDYNILVRDNAAMALQAVAREDPKLIAVAFPYLTDRSPDVRNVTLSLLADVAEETPEAVYAVLPRLLELVEDDRIDRHALLRTLAAIADERPADVAPALDGLLGWLPVEEERMEDALVLIFARLSSVDAEGVQEAIPLFVGYLTDASRDSRDPAARALVRIVDRDPDTVARIARKAAEYDQWERANVAHAVDAAVDEEPAGRLAAAIYGEDDGQGNQPFSRR